MNRLSELPASKSLMKAPPLLLGVTLLFWGFHTKHLPIAILLALVLESIRLIQWRWHLTEKEFERIWSLTVLFFVGTVFYHFMGSQISRTIYTLFQWLPVIVFPMVFCQELSIASCVDLDVFTWASKKKAPLPKKLVPQVIDLTYPYFGICILASSTVNERTIAFYIALTLLSAAALWTWRPKRFSFLGWSACLVIGSGLGYVGQFQLNQIQCLLEAKSAEWFSDTNNDAFESITSIGKIGQLKLSNQIMMRVEPEAHEVPPGLLRQAVYLFFKKSQWFSQKSDFTSVLSDENGEKWRFYEAPNEFQKLTISIHLTDGQALLPLPRGPFEIDRLPVERMDKNPLGTVTVEDGPPFVRYRVSFNEKNGIESPPNEKDLEVPIDEAAALESIISELNIKSRQPEEILHSVQMFFSKNFTYTTYLSLPHEENEISPIGSFLLHTRKGHCEYFATSTVLLLRKLGIPARYATGFAVEEYSKWEKLYLVRAKHAHAWVLAYINGAWQDVDTTPSRWIEVEKGTIPRLQSLYDFWNSLKFSLAKWRSRETSGFSRHIRWLIIPLIGLLAWRIFNRKRVSIKTLTVEAPQKIASGSDSEFYSIEKEWNRMGWARLPHESWSEWIQRLPKSDSLNQEFFSLLKLHYKYRFDPLGITPEERRSLKSRVEDWLRKVKPSFKS